MTSLQFGPLCLPPESEQVVDADEEIFLLYTDLQSGNQTSEAGTTFRGLGHIDSHKDVLTVTFELNGLSAPSVSPTKSKRDSRRTRKSEKETRVVSKPMEFEVLIAQDKTALRSRKGDTGSVLWHASVDFAKLILRQVHFPDPAIHMLVDRANLKECHILELGYTVTDIDDLVPLIQKNAQLNNLSSFDSNLVVSSLDWIALQQTSPSKRQQAFAFDPIDLLLVVDCIYHPFLLPPLLETLDFLATPGTTTVMVVVELRAADVAREFLQLWIGKPDWEVWRIADDGRFLGRPYVMWAGRKRAALS
ncbi:Ribosomal protein lysine methyltransferase [Marasmius crinis-equi]|uniref:Ribosomal protein lysine methyltransferase n=1 Tax=Marasmius crinis-equi TaxID=585013 RepID=A0ABR3F3D7_9AGAR